MALPPLEKSILTAEGLRAERDRLHAEGKKLVFTNGSFDILHIGHVQNMEWARGLGDALAVGVNTDDSVRRYKGPKRPICGEMDRAMMLAGLRAVDYVVLFDEDTPTELITKVLPDILVKGKDWSHFVPGREVVEANGGRVELAELTAGRSTTNLIEKIIEVYSEKGEG